MSQNSEKIYFERGKPFYVHRFEKKIMDEWVLHYHDCIEIFYLIDGKCDFFIDDKRYRLKSGDVVVIPPMVLHKAFYYQDIPITRYMLYCNTELIPKATTDVLVSSEHYVGYIPKSCGDVEDIFFRLNKEYHNPDILSKELICGYMTLLASIIFRSTEIRKALESRGSDNVVETAVSYLKRNYSTDITVEDVANYTSLSVGHLSRAFKSETGLGVKEYLVLYRIKQAEFMLLEHPSKSISEIAYDCGFNDSNYFASCFRKTVGVTPSDFRKKQEQ